MPRYVGRHRAPPTHHARRVAAVAVMAALPAVAAQVPAHAAPSARWDAIIACESGGDPTIVNGLLDAHGNHVSTASGAFQFLDSTWVGLGHAGRAKDASVAEQFQAADQQFAISGYTAWEASRDCWGPKIDATAAVVVTAAAHASNTPAPRHALPTGAPRHSITVASGDTVSQLAATTHVTVAELYARNRDVIGDDVNLIFPGQVLVT